MIIMMTRWHDDHDDHDDHDTVDGGGGFEHKPEEMWGIAESILTATFFPSDFPRVKFLQLQTTAVSFKIGNSQQKKNTTKVFWQQE